MRVKSTEFKKEWLAGYKNVTKPGVYEIEVASNVTDKNFYPAQTPDESDRHIVSLRAFFPDQAPTIKDLFSKADAVSYEHTKGLFATATLWHNDGIPPARLPMRGEKLMCTVGFVPNKEEQQVLRITNISAGKVDVAATINLNTFFGEEEEEEEQSSKGDVTQSRR